MKKWVLFGLLLVAAAVVAEEDENEAPECDPEACQLPNCRCSGTDIPGGLRARDVPQFVTITFDDAVNTRNMETYRRVLYNRRNANNCPAGVTFYVNHEYTSYLGVNELYNRGFEIALHSMSHQVPQSYWAEVTYEDMVLEFAHQRIQMAHFANIPFDTIKGIRLPFLQMSGNTSFEMMARHDFLYDCSWPTVAHTNPGLWPYTLDYRSTQDCIIPPCPTGSIPGPWVMPMVSWLDLLNVPCSFVDTCYWIPDLNDEQGWYNFIVANFERHYNGNRAPFPFYVHEWFIAVNPAVERAFVRFLNLINSLNDVFMVNSQEVIEWVKNPITIAEYRQKPCKSFIPTTCRAISCTPLQAEHNGNIYWLDLCNVCPRVYPWLGNPLGQ
ncbi:chitin deacetylase 8-like [Anticarsia gemmatalis]|uniref:chitin deacetylase 8-like n=1 Tax=Anticarsia gemmatalis TaxID=129554 RepID=UPI003F75B332